MSLSGSKKDNWGIRQLEISVDEEENDALMIIDNIWSEQQELYDAIKAMKVVKYEASYLSQ